jgi:hypothetical protein
VALDESEKEISSLALLSDEIGHRWDLIVAQQIDAHTRFQTPQVISELKSLLLDSNSESLQLTLSVRWQIIERLVRKHLWIFEKHETVLISRNLER